MRGWFRERPVLTSIVLAGVLSACGSTAPVDVTRGGLYVSDLGRELFVYRYDTSDASRYPCAAECAPAWTPLYAGRYDRGGRDFTILVRDDGNWQWAYRGHPVYFYAGKMRALAADAQMSAGLWVPLVQGTQ
jgi:predicted lipoprotein with Yx(FWY)xxD motif